MISEQSVSKGPHTSGMINTPEYPFRYVGVLFPQFRDQAMRDIEYHRQQLLGTCHFFMPRATKAEFMVWVREQWEEASDEFNDYMSKPQA